MCGHTLCQCTILVTQRWLTIPVSRARLFPIPSTPQCIVHGSAPRRLPSSFEFVDVLGGFRYALGTVLGYKSAVLVEDLDLRMGLVGIGAVRPLILVAEPHGAVVGTPNFLQTVI